MVREKKKTMFFFLFKLDHPGWLLIYFQFICKHFLMDFLSFSYSSTFYIQVAQM